MALTRVPLTNVTPEQIKEVLADYTIDTNNVPASSLFKSGNINKNYIDPDWCAGDTEDDRFNELSTDDPISFYDYINYGGEEGDVPEIYFSEIIDRDGVDFIDVAEDGKALHITLGPDRELANTFNNGETRISPNDRVNASASMYYRDTPEEFLNRLLLNLKVKCDHGNTILNNIQYKIKVTATIGEDYVIKEEVEYFGHPENITIPMTSVVSIGGPISAATTGDGLASIIGGSNEPLHWQWIKNAASSIGNGAIVQLTSCVAIAVATAYVMDFIFDLTDTLDAPYEGWHSYFNQTAGVYNDFDIRESGLKYGVGYKNQRTIDVDESFRVKDGTFETPVYNFDLPEYETVTEPLLTNDDLNSDSQWFVLGDFTFGSNIVQKNPGIEGSIVRLLTTEYNLYYRIRYKVHNNDSVGTIEFDDSSFRDLNIIEDLVNPNSSGTVEYRAYAKSFIGTFALSFSDDFDGYIYDLNVEVLYEVSPGNSNPDIISVKEGYHVLEFEPRGRQYNEVTPPPPTTYIVELVPVSNCKLSDTKVGMFLTTTAPDKDDPPVFNVIPKPVLNRGSLVKFENARYADLIACKDLEKPNLLGSYQHFVINGLGGYATGDKYFSFKGLDIIEYVQDVWDSKTGRYEVIFGKEANIDYQQMIFNRNFINRSNNNTFVNVTDYWNIPSNWNLQDGSISLLNEGDPVTQYSELLVHSINWHKLYLIEIDILNRTNGYAYIDTTNIFENKLYSKYTESIFGSVHGVEVVSLPSNVTISGNQIRLNANGHYSLIVKTLDNSIDSILKLNANATFDGNITQCACRRLSHTTALDRISPMINGVHQVDVSSTQLSNTLNLIYIPTTFSGLLGDELIITLGNFPYDTDVNIDWDNGTTTDLSILANTTINTGFVYDQSYINRVFNIKITITNSNVMKYLEIHNTNLKYIIDDSDVLYDAELILSNCNLINYVIGQQQFSQFKRLSTLDVSNNNNLECDVALLGNISSSINLNNTKSYGDLSELNGTVNYINIENTNIYKYSSIPNIITKELIWKNTINEIDVLDLNALIRDVYNSSINNGILDISGNNPDIVENELLYYIFDLVHRRNWTILYNGYYITEDNLDNYVSSNDDDYIYVKD